MEVVSVNKGGVTTVSYKGTQVKTGIFKYPVNHPIFLGDTDVDGDKVVDRKHHGGVDKAVYAYNLDHYPFWKEEFPDLKWSHGMFGENLTIKGMQEDKMFVGSLYQIGEAQVQVCQPRQPCFKLGIRFNTQEVLKTFVNNPFPGIYFRVIKPGLVSAGDCVELMKKESDSPSIAEVYSLMYHQQQGGDNLIRSAISCASLPKACKDRIIQIQNISG